MDARAQTRYRNETRRLVARRGPICFVVFLLGVTVAGALEIYYHADRLASLLLVSALELAICAGAVRAYRSSRLAPTSIEITVLAAVALASSVTLYFTLTGGDGSALAFVVLGFEFVTALMFPWGARRQLALTLACVALYVLYVGAAMPAAGGTLPAAYGSFAVVFGGAMSVVGAWFLDRQRRSVFEQRERLSRHVSAFRDLTQTFHGFDPLRALLVTCVSTLQALPLHRLWAVWRVPGDGGVQAYFARRDREGVQLESLTDPRRLWSEVLGWGEAHEAFLAMPGDPRVPVPLRSVAAAGVLCIPMRFEGESLGAICADAGGEGLDLSEEEQAFATVLGGGAAIAMANARLYHRATTASEEKSTFLARIAHELRNPLHTLLWDIDTLRGQGGGPESTIDRLRQNTLLTLNVAEELQEFSEVETRRLTARAEPVALAQVFDELGATAVALLANRPITFNSTIGSGAEMLVTDPHRIRQILGNLLSNAAKFTWRGSIDIEAARWGESIALSVTDTGAGIEASELEAIFAPFYRGHARAAGITRGMGLGLAIAQEIATLLRGRIEVESTPGVGSTFRVVLPAGTAAPVATASAPEAALPGTRVLLIEDDAVERSRTAAALRQNGAEVLEARDGFEGLRRAREHRPDLIVLDLGLPGLSGIDVLGRLRRDGELASVPVIVATAHTDGRLEAHCREAGCIAYLRKPYASGDLLAAARRVVEEQPALARASAG